jgi:DNA processing protein
LQSGSLITARLTNDQGKDVFAIPGSIHSAQSRGCHALIKQGAKLVESVDDILDELQWRSSVKTNIISIADKPYSKSAEGDFDVESVLLAALGFDPVGLDTLQARTGLAAPSLQAQLMVLELAGQVASLPGGLFQRQRV